MNKKMAHYAANLQSFKITDKKNWKKKQSATKEHSTTNFN